MNDPEFLYVIYIRAMPQKVWEALTGEGPKAFWFGCWFESDWKAGSPLVCMTLDGVDFTGEVLESDPPNRVVFTFLDEGKLKSEGATRVTYELDEVEGATRLRVTHDRFRAGSRLRPGVAQGWPVILSGLKSFVETGRAFDTDMIKDASAASV